MIRVALADKPGVENAKLKARFNSQYCRALEDVPMSYLLAENPDFNPFPRAKRGLQFAVPLETMNHGYNVVELILPHGDSAQEVVWVEILIRPESQG